MISPVWPGDCPVTQPYGCTTLTVEPYFPACPTKHKHTGIDVGMAVGTPLYIARAGIVINISYGLLGVQVGKENDWYVHIDRVADAVRFGQPVAKGQLGAYSGAKVPAGGSLDGPHLHFEVQTGQLNDPNTSQDPVPVLTAQRSVDMVIALRASDRKPYLLSVGPGVPEGGDGLYKSELDQNALNVLTTSGVTLPVQLVGDAALALIPDFPKPSGAATEPTFTVELKGTAIPQ